MRCARSWRNYPGVQTEVVTFLGDRISESLTGDTGDVAVKIFGDQLDALDATARQVDAALSGNAGDRGSAVQAPERHAHFCPAAEARRAGGRRSQGRRCAGRGAKRLSRARRWARPMPASGPSMCVMLLPAEQRNRPEMMAGLMISGPLGPVPLSRSRASSPPETRAAITHDGGQRFDVLTFNVVGRSLQADGQ